jgi:hypothetical protein
LYKAYFNLEEIMIATEHAILARLISYNTLLFFTWRNRRLPSPPQINLSVHLHMPVD